MNTKEIRSQRNVRRFVVVLVIIGSSWLNIGCANSSTEVAPSGSSSASHSSEAPAPPAGPEELALVAPLVVGGSLADFSVTEIQAVRKGVLNIVCRKDRSTVRLWIALANEKGPEPPARTDKFAIFYSAGSAGPADAERLAKALAEIVAKHSDVPVPKGLTEFVPTGIPL